MYELFPKAKYAVIPNTKCKCRNNPWLAVAQIMTLKQSAAAALLLPNPWLTIAKQSLFHNLWLAMQWLEQPKI